MNVLSLFDGISCGQIALERAGIKVDNYFASEIDKQAIQITQSNYPNTIQLGNVENWREWELPKINLIMGGSPCQGFSKAGKGLNFFDPRSKLFFRFADIVKELKPDYFFLENVAMRKEARAIISDFMAVPPIKINSRLLTAQNRERYYWTNIPGVTMPEDKGILLKDVLDNSVSDNYLVRPDFFERNVSAGVQPFSFIDEQTGAIVWRIPEATKKGYVDIYEGESVDLTFISSKTRRGRRMADKSNCLTASGIILARAEKGWFRLFTPAEWEKLQSVPVDYTNVVMDGKFLTDGKRKKMVGNGWTVDVIAHIFSGLK